MKKLLSIMLTLFMLQSMANPVFAAGLDGAVSVTISGGQSYMNEITTENKSIVDGLANLLDSSVSSSVKPASVRSVALITFTFSDRQESRTVSTDANGELYVHNGARLRGIDSDAFYSIVNGISGLYKFREIPAATASSQKLGVVNSSYSFDMLDGQFYKATYEKSSGPALSLVKGKLPVPAFSMQPKEVDVTVSESGSKNSLWSGYIKDMASFKPEKSGKYRVEFKAIYSQPHAKGEVVYAYNISYDTDINFTIDGARTNPGEIVVLRAKNVPDGSAYSVKTGISYTPKFFREAASGDLVALLPVSYYTSPGSYNIEFICGGYSKKLGITVADKKFTVQNLTVPAETTQQTINNQKANDEFEKYMVPVRKIADSKQHWEGQFIWPLKVASRVTTQFGTIRYTNGGSTPSRHGAIDFAAAAGTPVYASNNGRVVFSGFLQLTGHTIVIEHGYGLKTWHYHMNGRNVQTGDMVKKGQQIGIVGSTGFSTGAHLHFGMSVSNEISGNQFINPETAISTNIVADLAKNAS